MSILDTALKALNTLQELTAAATFEFTAGPFSHGELQVIGFKGDEAISELFSFDVLVSISAAALTERLEETILAKPACLTLAAAGRISRVVHGITSSFTLEGTSTEDSRILFRARLVPKLWLLTQAKRSRIFQELTTSEIVDEILEHWRIPCTWKLVGRELPARRYCTQYQETDYEFILRLLAEDGISFRFEPPSDDAGDDPSSDQTSRADADSSAEPEDDEGPVETVVFFNHECCYPPIPSSGGMGNARPTLRFAPSKAERDDENSIVELLLRRSVLPNAALLTRYDHRSPGLKPRDTMTLAGMKAASDDGQSEPLEVAARLPEASLTVYEHHERVALSDAASGRAGTVALQQLRRDAYEGIGTSRNWRLAPGCIFGVEWHPINLLNHEYVVTRIEHHGGTKITGAENAEDIYRNTFRCVPAEVNYRPAPPPARLAQVTETALVVGPDSPDDLHVDEEGRIKIQFHWDLDGDEDEHSSCWVRVMQPVAGSGWGSQFIPRVGMEVVVTFVKGDPDQPLVTGCVYNGRNSPPFSLPGDKTRSGFRSQSSPGGAGASELSFQDAAGLEEVLLRAQRNLNIHVRNDHSFEVDKNQQHVVGGVWSEAAAARFETIYGPKGSRVAGNRTDAVEGDFTTEVTGERREEVKGVEARVLRGAQSLRVGGTRSLWVEGALSTMVGTKQRPAEVLTSVLGLHTTFATDTIHLRSEKRIVLEVGSSRLVIDPDQIRIETKDLMVLTKEKTMLQSQGSEVHLGNDQVEVLAKKVNLYSQGASLELASNADLNGEQVNLNCGGGSANLTEVNGEKPKLKPLKLQLHDDDLQPFAGKKYRLFVSGLKFEGTTDGSGGLTEQVPEEAKIGQLTIWLDDYPTGTRVYWPIEMTEDSLPDATAVDGALIRLRELGYYAGPIAKIAPPAAAGAIRIFQEDYKIEVTGELCAATAKKLKDVYGA
jgi:type VI secretion system secreted protein VgrG